jgi:hypothetical protein
LPHTTPQRRHHSLSPMTGQRRSSQTSGSGCVATSRFATRLGARRGDGRKQLPAGIGPHRGRNMRLEVCPEVAQHGALQYATDRRDALRRRAPCGGRSLGQRHDAPRHGDRTRTASCNRSA